MKGVRIIERYYPRSRTDRRPCLHSASIQWLTGLTSMQVASMDAVVLPASRNGKVVPPCRVHKYYECESVQDFASIVEDYGNTHDWKMLKQDKKHHANMIMQVEFQLKGPVPCT